MDKKETSMLLRHCMASMMNEVYSIALEKKNHQSQISYGDLFDQAGYGFVGARTKRTCPYNLLIEIDPK